MKKQFLWAALAAVTLFGSSCNNDDPNQEKQEGNEVTFVVGGINSRTTTDFSNLTATFANGDKIGIYGTSLETDVTNAELTYNGTSLSSSAIKFKDADTQASFKAYYPYQSTATTTSFDFSVQTDQSTEANFNNSDFLVATATGTKGQNITLDFAHQMALIKVTLSEDFTNSLDTDETISSITINANPTATCNFNQDTPTVEATTDGTADDIKMFCYTDGNNVSTYYCIIPAQTINCDGSTPLLTITTPERAFLYKFTGSKEFSANQTYPITIQNGEVFSISSVSITGWGSTATEDSWSVEEEKDKYTLDLTANISSESNNTHDKLTSTNLWASKGVTVEYNSEESALKIASSSVTTNQWYNYYLSGYIGDINLTSKYKITYKAKAEANSNNLDVFILKTKKITIGTAANQSIILSIDNENNATSKIATMTSTTISNDEYTEYTFIVDPTYWASSPSTSIDKVTNTTDEGTTVAIAFKANFSNNCANGTYYIKNIKIEEQ